MDLVLDIGNFRIKGAFFLQGKLHDLFKISPNMDMLKTKLLDQRVDRILISSVNTPIQKEVERLFSSLELTFNVLDFSKVKLQLDVEEPEALGHDRIANVYGALSHFPQNNCIVVDIGTAVTFDVVGCNGSYLGGAIYPGIDISAKALAEYTDKLPLVEMEKPKSPIAKSTKTHIQSGLYWGLLGAIERITSEMRQMFDAPSDIKILATGGGAEMLTKMEFTKDLEELVDVIDPALTLIGLYEIMKEK